MDQSRPETSVLVGATSRPLIGPVWWVVIFGALTTADWEHSRGDSLVAATFASCALLLTLGIDPVALLLDL